MSDIESQVKAGMQATIEHLKQSLKALRTGRANAGILDKVQVEVHGTRMSLKALGTITVPESRQIVVTPFDYGNINAISKAIEAANLGIQPRVDGKVVRIPVPPLDESLRKQIAKQCQELGEKSKIALREVRRKFNEQIRKQKADGVLGEDVMKRLEKVIQELTDRFCKECDTVCAEKSQEIMTV
jgi:ribosome recycling factor